MVKILGAVIYLKVKEIICRSILISILNEKYIALWWMHCWVGIVNFYVFVFFPIWVPFISISISFIIGCLAVGLPTGKWESVAAYRVTCAEVSSITIALYLTDIWVGYLWKKWAVFYSQWFLSFICCSIRFCTANYWSGKKKKKKRFVLAISSVWLQWCFWSHSASKESQCGRIKKMPYMKCW